MLRRLSILPLIMIGLSATFAFADEPEEPKESKEREVKTAVRVWPLFSYESGSKGSKLNVLDLLLVKLYGGERSEDRKEVELLDVTVAELYAREKDDEESRTTILEVLWGLGTLYSHEAEEDGDVETTVLDATVVSLVEREESAEKSDFEVLGSILPLTFFRTQSSDDGTFDHQVVTLPILGSLFRHERNDERTKTTFLFIPFVQSRND